LIEVRGINPFVAVSSARAEVLTLGLAQTASGFGTNKR
jgi:hypothetical protein